MGRLEVHVEIEGQEETSNLNINPACGNPKGPDNSHELHGGRSLCNVYIAHVR